MLEETICAILLTNFGKLSVLLRRYPSLFAQRSYSP